MKTVLLFEFPGKGFKAVKSGFSWPGFFFMFLWAFAKGLYGFGMLLFCFWLVIGGTYAMAIHEAWNIPDSIYAVLLLIYAVVIGITGNKYLSQSLARRGYTLVRTVQAESAGVALAEARAAANGQPGLTAVNGF